MFTVIIPLSYTFLWPVGPCLWLLSMEFNVYILLYIYVCHLCEYVCSYILKLFIKYCTSYTCTKYLCTLVSVSCSTHTYKSNNYNFRIIITIITIKYSFLSVVMLILVSQLLHLWVHSLLLYSVYFKVHLTVCKHNYFSIYDIIIVMHYT